MAAVDVALPDLAMNGSTVVETAAGPVMFCRSTAGLHALRPLCPHQHQTLEGARIRGVFLVCPHHGARFSLEDGRSLSPLTDRPLELFKCRIEHDRVLIDT